MNIDDVDIPDQELTIESVFAQQEKLMDVYKEIEGRHGEVDLDTKAGQAQVKDFLWRISEELGEALDSNLGTSHIKEELADGLHFLIELCIFTGRKEVAMDTFVALEQNFRYPVTITQLVISLADVGRVCKNKPWKQTQIPMDQRAFTTALVKLIEDYMQYYMQYLGNIQEAYFYYHKKAKVNEFRQRSKY